MATNFLIEMVNKFDVIIIGTGAGAGPVIDSLAQSGMNICVIERGGFMENNYEFGDELYHILKKSHIPDVSKFPIEFVEENGNISLKERSWVSHAVGGGTMLWYGHLLRLREEDFLMHTNFHKHPGAEKSDLQDWPVDFKEFSKSYLDVEKKMELFSPMCDYDDSNTLNPPLLDNSIDKLVYPSLKKLGLNPYKTPTCLGGNAFDLRPINPLTNEIINEKFIDYRKNSLNVFIRPHSLKNNFSLLTFCIAKKIIHKNGKVEGISVLDTKTLKEKTLYAPKVIVCCSAIESSLLFLKSNIPNQNDLIGRNLTYLTDCTAQCVVPISKEKELKEVQQMLGTLTVDDYYFINDSKEPILFKGGKISVSERKYEKGPIDFGLKVNGWGKQWKENIKKLQENHVLHFSFKGEALPLKSNRVEIGKTLDFWGMNIPRISYKLHNHDIALANYMAEKLKKICLACGSDESDIKISPRIKSVHGHGHQHGTLRFGDNPETSVLNPYCESHVIKGLFALDGSFMPTSGGMNSSLTIMANSSRVAKHILDESLSN